MHSINGYSILELIHESNTSLIFRGKWDLDGKPVVLKISKSTHPNPRELSRYRHEYEILASLDINTVIAVEGFDEYEKILIIIEEDFSGESLKKLFTSHYFSIEEKLNVFVSIASTLSQLHNRHIVHKDINPSNIVYNPHTKTCKLIDFGIAANLSASNPAQNHATVLEGTLAYISPEQTGRVNRSIDYRSDLYSFGVTMYELLTGELPFRQTEAVELVHAHIATTPPTVREVNPDVPPVLSEIVSRLMNKTAEHRYQSAAGLREDLKTCLHLFQTTGRIDQFELGREDRTDVFYLPQKLYGRERETATLLSAFNEQIIGCGAMKFMLISGYSGTGKTSLVKEIQKPVIQSKGYFIEGKFDQYQRTVPYCALKLALAQLVDIWLAQSEASLAVIASALEDALGEVAGLLTQLIPSLELIIGPQPEVTELSGIEAQNRFNLLCRNFFRCVASADHPLALFIDDLQWADLPSLNLISVLLTDSQIKYFFFIGSYRDNETPASHPLLLMLEALSRKGIRPESVHVGNLSESDIGALCADVLHSDLQEVLGLAQLVHTKTLGNPFFTTQFLKALYTEKLLAFDAHKARWSWELEEIKRRNIPDDVVQLMTAKIIRLAPATQKLLALAACIGNTFYIDALSVIYEKDDRQTENDLSEAVREGLLIQYDSISYRFSHDRIQQASYSLMEDGERVHLRIGRLLLQNASKEILYKRVFEIANQLNMARRLITNSDERLELARLNQNAGRQAKNAAAYTSALKYFSIAAELLPENAWSNYYELTFSIYNEMAWCLYYAGETQKIESIVAKLLLHVRDLQDKIKVYEIRMEYYHLEGNYGKAIKVQKEALKFLGVEVDSEKISIFLSSELETVPKLLGDRTIEELENAPLMDSPHQKLIMNILMGLWTSAYLDSQLELVAWSSCKMTNISLEYGNNPLTSYGYMNYAFVCVAMLGHYETGHRFGKVAIRLAEKFDDLLMRGKVYLLFAVFVNHWCAPLATSLEYSLKSFPLLMENGDWTYAGYCSEFIISDPTLWGASCEKLHEDAIKYLPFLRDNAPVVLDEFFIPACLNPILQLLGKTKNNKTFDDDHFSEEVFLEQYKKNHLALSYFYTAKLRSLYWFGYVDDALAMIDKADFVASVAFAQAKVPEIYFFASLTALACFDKINEEKWDGYEILIARYQEKMKVWAENSPANFLHKYLLVEAERAHARSQYWEALQLFESAIEEAKKSGYINNEALAYECAARFFLKQGLTRIATQHMIESLYAYRKWGAVAKVEQIRRDFADLLSVSLLRTDQRTNQSRSTSSTTQEIESTTESLDLLSIVQASHSLASEINLEKLLPKMMKIVTENAGATRLVLLTHRQEKWCVMAEARSAWNQVSIVSDVDFDEQTALSLPISFFNYCTRKQEGVVLGHASKKGNFVNDPYFISTGMKSVLCLPLKRSETFKGVLYLENNLVEDSFTPERLKVLELLATQIAISIENAEFYRSLEQLVEKRNAELVRVNKDLMEANQQLENLSNIDGLTGISNRRAFERRLELEWKRHQRMEYEFAVILCDIDYFKQYNDTCGHLEGDRCLKRVAQAIDAAARRPGDLAARYGGEEFVVIVSETDEGGVRSVVNNIQENLKKLAIPHPGSLVNPYVTLSLGAIHTIPQKGQEIKDAVHTADLALYEAKSGGRNRAVITYEISSCKFSRDSEG